VSENDTSAYEVGYKRPPKKTQFKPGQSGNLNGRPKRKLTLLEIIEKALDKRVNVTEKGRKVSKTLREVCGAQVATAMAKGDIKSVKLYLEAGKHQGHCGLTAFSQPEELDLADKTVADFLRRAGHIDDVV
jgi:hypothetical protein